MKRLPMFLILLGAAFLTLYLTPEGTGFRVECHNVDCMAWAQGSLLAIFYGLAFFLLVCLLPRGKLKPIAMSSVGAWHRLGAIYVNIMVIGFVLLPLTVFLILLTETMHTGEFQWSFYREFARGTDWLVIGGSMLLMCVLGFHYYYKSLVNDRPTIGHYLMGYRIISKSDAWTRKRAFGRMRLTLMSLGDWGKKALTAALDGKKAEWIDRNTDSFAERFDYASEEEMLMR